jgi:hypothetical protein
MVMLRSFIGWHMLWPFKSQVIIFLKINSCFILFVDQVDALICVFARKYSNVGRYLTSYVGNMTTNLGLN